MLKMNGFRVYFQKIFLKHLVKKRPDALGYIDVPILTMTVVSFLVVKTFVSLLMILEMSLRKDLQVSGIMITTGVAENLLQIPRIGTLNAILFAHVVLLQLDYETEDFSFY